MTILSPISKYFKSFVFFEINMWDENKVIPSVLVLKSDRPINDKIFHHIESMLKLTVSTLHENRKGPSEFPTP